VLTTGTVWPALAEAPPLAEGELRCVRASLDAPSERVEQLRASLSEDELKRADRFRMEVHRRRFAVGRGFLRALLASHLGAAPDELRFAYGPQGKPRLEGPGRYLRFNLSHSRDLALAAISRGIEVGVDLEKIRSQVDLEGIARRFFSPAEAADLLARPEAERPLAFFRCWTRKEAFIKAKGGGLSIPLSDFRVTLGSDEGAALVEVDWDPGEMRRWRLLAFSPAPEFAAAIVAANRPGLRLSTFDWSA
jgi:4'-phosphopantetheinyl transferase